MDTELDAFLFQELNYQSTPMSSLKTLIDPNINNNVSSSWVNQNDVYIPLLPQDHHHHHHHLLNFSSSSVETDPKVLDSPLNFLDLYDFNQQPRILENSDSTNYNQPDVLLVLDKRDNNVFLGPEDCFDMFLNDHDDQITAIFNDPPSTATMLMFSSSNAAEKNSEERQELPQVHDHGDHDDLNYKEKEPIDHDVDSKSGVVLNCKNLVWERKRRKRLAQQLLALRALVPNITKMDKRSVLVDALNYLRNIQEEIARLQKEVKQLQQQQPAKFTSNLSKGLLQDNTIDGGSIPRMLACASASKSRAHITKIEAEKIEDKRFVVKMTCMGSKGVGGDVLRVFEALGFEIVYTALQQIKSSEMITTMFIRVRKPGKMTEQRLKDCVTNMAVRSGLKF